MGITDKISGRLKKAAGDPIVATTIRAVAPREGRKDERKGEAKDELAPRGGARETREAADEIATPRARPGYPLSGY